MDYERKYKDALGWMQSLYDCLHGATKEDAEHYFPELKESEDEKIRKGIIKYLYFIKDKDGSYMPNNIPFDDMIAWLEKQGESNPADKIGPKFHEGNWVVYNNPNAVSPICQIAEVDEDIIDLIGLQGERFQTKSLELNENYHLWTIKDAKDGDVLNANGAPFIYKKHDKNFVYFYCGINLADEFIIANNIDTWNNNSKVYPATKEQRDLLFQKMKESGYEWDAEKKELKEISQRMISAEAKEALYDKPTWSEEDERICRNIVNDIANDKSMCKYEISKGICDEQINWLKSLKQRLKGK